MTYGHWHNPQPCQPTVEQEQSAQLDEQAQRIWDLEDEIAELKELLEAERKCCAEWQGVAIDLKAQLKDARKLADTYRRQLGGMTAAHNRLKGRAS